MSEIKEASTFWYELRVNFYIENGTGEYELDETLTIPRNKLRVGMALFEGLDRKGGWTRWATCMSKPLKPTE